MWINWPSVCGDAKSVDAGVLRHPSEIFTTTWEKGVLFVWLPVSSCLLVFDKEYQNDIDSAAKGDFTRSLSSIFRDVVCAGRAIGVCFCPVDILRWPPAVKASARDLHIFALSIYHHYEFEVDRLRLWQRGLEGEVGCEAEDRKSTRLNSSHKDTSRMPSSA